MATRAIGRAAARDDQQAARVAERAAAYAPAGMEPGRLLLPSNAALPTPTRLVVLVPNVDLDEAALARHIWRLAAPRHLAVLYLGWTAGAETEAQLRRRLANLAALTRDEGVAVSARPALGAGWLPALRGVWRPGDLIVAHSELRVRRWGPMAQPLAAALLAALEAPVYVLTGFVPRPQRPALNWGARLFNSGLLVAIIAVFFALQAALLQLPGRPLVSLLVSVSVVIEFALLWGWNRLSG
ncbi:MAG: hypothetical protein IT317_02550 [Anaerolineales bacterium]|nr:hypothetical protein [Anaerolineales bacterium]